MPLFEYRCGKCAAITEALTSALSPWRDRNLRELRQCGGDEVAFAGELQSRAPAKYSDESLDKAKPFLERQRANAQYFTEGDGSDDSKTFELAEQIGKRIDRTLASQLPTCKN